VPVNRTWMWLLAVSLWCIWLVATCLRVCAFVTRQYNLVLTKGWWCAVAGKLLAGLAESNGSLLHGLWLKAPRLTTERFRSTPDQCLYRVWDYLHLWLVVVLLTATVLWLISCFDLYFVLLLMLLLSSSLLPESSSSQQLSFCICSDVITMFVSL